MCDELTAKDAEEYLRRNAVTRREFSKRGAGAALAMMLPPVANALDVVEQDVMVVKHRTAWPTATLCTLPADHTLRSSSGLTLSAYARHFAPWASVWRSRDIRF